MGWAARNGSSAAHRASPAEPADPAGRAGLAADHAPAAGTPAAHHASAEPAAASASHAADPGAIPGSDWPASVEKPGSRAEPAAAPVGEWETPADRTRQAAESALKPAIAQRLTDAGLPTRRPGAQLAPGAVVPRVREQTGGASFRDAAAVRTSLSRHYQGMRAARQESAARAEESGKDEVDPR